MLFNIVLLCIIPREILLWFPRSLYFSSQSKCCHFIWKCLVLLTSSYLLIYPVLWWTATALKHPECSRLWGSLFWAGLRSTWDEALSRLKDTRSFTLQCFNGMKAVWLRSDSKIHTHTHSDTLTEFYCLTGCVIDQIKMYLKLTSLTLFSFPRMHYSHTVHGNSAGQRQAWGERQTETEWERQAAL